MMISFSKKLQGAAGIVVLIMSAASPLVSLAAELENSAVVPTSAVVNGSNVLFAEFKNSSTVPATVLIDLEMHNALGARVEQQFVDNVTFGAGDIKSFTMPTPAGLPAGTYHFDIGVFKPHWDETLYWQSNAGEVAIDESGSTGGKSTGTVSLVDNSQFDENSTSVGKVNSLTALFEVVGGSVTGLFDLELYNSEGKRVGQSFFDNTRVNEGERYAQHLAVNNLPADQYQWKVGIFSPGWESLIAWYDDAGRFTIDEVAASDQSTTTPAAREHNGSIAIASVDMPKENIFVGDTPSINARLISENGENANGVTVFVRLYDSENNVAAEHSYTGQDILHEEFKTYSLTVPSVLYPGSYRVAVEVLNPSGSVNRNFENLGTVVVK